MLLNPKAHNHVHSCLPLATILRQVKPVHALPSHFFEIHYSVILAQYFKRPLSFMFPHQNPLFMFLLSSLCATHQAQLNSSHCPWFDKNNRPIW